MGIDIYMRWPGQTAEQEQAQYTGFAIDKGDVGYLREAYHGPPYATRVLAPEAFASDNGEARILAATLRERLPKAVRAAVKREAEVYADPDAIRMAANFANSTEAELRSLSPVESLYAFVELAERMEQETGEAVTIIASY